MRQTGQGPPTREAWNNLVKSLEGLVISPGPGMLMRRTATGTALWPRKRRGTSGTSGTAAADPAPLTIATSRPSYIPAPTIPVPANHRRVWINWGSCQGQLARNWSAHFDCPQTPDDHDEEEDEPIANNWFWAQITFGAGTNLTVAEWEVVRGSTADAFINAPWPAGTGRPEVYYHPLGQVFSDGTEPFNTGGGSLLVSEFPSSIANGSKPGVAALTMSIYVQREGY